jgi:hypothetical protein
VRKEHLMDVVAEGLLRMTIERPGLVTSRCPACDALDDVAGDPEWRDTFQIPGGDTVKGGWVYRMVGLHPRLHERPHRRDPRQTLSRCPRDVRPQSDPHESDPHDEV